VDKIFDREIAQVDQRIETIERGIQGIQRNLQATFVGDGKDRIPGHRDGRIIEIQAGVRRGEEKKTHALLDSLKAYDVTPAIANLAGRFIRDHRAKGITLDFVDSIIAATAAIHNLTLLTYKIKHYPMPEVKLYSP